MWIKTQDEGYIRSDAIRGFEARKYANGNAELYITFENGEKESILHGTREEIDNVKGQLAKALECGRLDTFDVAIELNLFRFQKRHEVQHDERSEAND